MFGEDAKVCGSRGWDVAGPLEGLISDLGFDAREQLLSAQLPLALLPPAPSESLQCHVLLSGLLSVVGSSIAPHRVGVRSHLFFRLPCSFCFRVPREAPWIQWCHKLPFRNNSP